MVANTWNRKSDISSSLTTFVTSSPLPSFALQEDHLQSQAILHQFAPALLLYNIKGYWSFPQQGMCFHEGAAARLTENL